MKTSKEKKRKRSHRESEERNRKRRSAESKVEDPKAESNPAEGVQQQQHLQLSDIEEGGLDLNVPLKPISTYLSDRQEMLEQCFHVLGQTKLMKMLPDELKECSFPEIKKLCWEQLQQLSETNLLQILEGREVTANIEAKEKETKRSLSDSQQDNNVDSTSSVKEGAEAEDKQGLSGEESDVLSINADMDDSDIEGHRDPKPEQQEVPATKATPPLAPLPPAPPPEPDLRSEEPKLELQSDIDKSVCEILALTVSAPPVSDPLQLAAVDIAPASLPVAPTAPSAQQLALLELEMRARAIKALMKASELKK